MAQPYVGEIRMFAGNFAPAGWMLCDGALLSIAENETLFALIGTTYGGDGQSTFALPDLRGRIPAHIGQNYQLGESGGVESVALGAAQMPAHNHALYGSAAAASPLAGPSGSLLATTGATAIYGDPPAQQPNPAQMSPSAIGPAGGNQAHDNMAPYLCVNFIISLFGIFPSQT